MKHSTKESFSSLPIAPKFLHILEAVGYVTPTPIQAQAIPVAITGKDCIGIAQTGTGKTLAFGIPMIQRLATHKGLGLVVLPTRELAVQVEQTLHKIGKPLGLKTALLIGGEAMGKQLKALRQKPHIVIATPGRLIDHLEQETIGLSTVKVLVLDEADRMLDMGFAPQLNKILEHVPKERQTLLFSATMPDEIVSIAKKYMKLPVRVEVAPPGKAADTVAQEVIFVSKPDKISLLEKILNEEPGTVLVFTRTKFGAKKIARVVRNLGHSSAELHSDRTLNQRLGALEGFKKGKHRVLVATDIAARGLDVTNIALVINFDLPAQAEDYVHRIGRTGRAGLAGRAISFATPDQKRDVRDIERLIRAVLPVSPAPRDLPKREITEHPASREASPNFRSHRPVTHRAFDHKPQKSSSPKFNRPKRSEFKKRRPEQPRTPKRHRHESSFTPFFLTR